VNAPEDVLAGILAEHPDCMVVDYDAEGMQFACGTVLLLPGPDRGVGLAERIVTARRAHLAQVLAEYVAEREAQAWDEGKAAGLREGKVVTPFHDRFRSVNPYRKDREADRG
jgi:hypothetical protein